MIWVDSGALPQSAYIRYEIKKGILQLRVRDLCDANGMLKEMRDIKPPLLFPKPEGRFESVSVVSAPDASLKLGSSKNY